jgi:hypothetical protein
MKHSCQLIALLWHSAALAYSDYFTRTRTSAAGGAAKSFAVISMRGRSQLQAGVIARELGRELDEVRRRAKASVPQDVPQAEISPSSVELPNAKARGVSGFLALGGLEKRSVENGNGKGARTLYPGIMSAVL